MRDYEGKEGCDLGAFVCLISMTIFHTPRKVEITGCRDDDMRSQLRPQLRNPNLKI